MHTDLNAQQDLFPDSDLVHSPRSERSLQDGVRLLCHVLCVAVGVSCDTLLQHVRCGVGMPRGGTAS
jgi:hypothetical protein